jgi:two-component system, OmpR family, response regulator
VSDKGHILIVDDEKAICEAIEEYLTLEGYRVSIAHDGAAMQQLMSQTRFDIVLLDLMFPKDDGLTIARSLGGRPDIGIVMMTGRGEVIDRIVGLEMGADDYLVKPFHLAELLARIKSVTRRVARRQTGAPKTEVSQVRFAGWSLGLASRDLLSASGEAIRLTAGEFELLSAFVTHPNRLLSRDYLSELVRHRAAGPFDRTIDMQVARLRRKLADDPQNPGIIKTVRGAGYIFTAALEFGGTVSPAS